MKSQTGIIQWFVNNFKGMDMIKRALAHNCNKMVVPGHTGRR